MSQPQTPPKPSTLWLTRAGSSGEFESRFLDDGRVYLTWEDLPESLAGIETREAMLDLLKETHPDANPNRLKNHRNQIWAFLDGMTDGDWVVLPSKKKGAIHIGRITGGYEFDLEGDRVYRHFRKVDWFAPDIPRSNFDHDLLHSFGAFLTICTIKRNDALERVYRMAQKEWAVSRMTDILTVKNAEGEEGEEEFFDIERIARDQIVKWIGRKYAGHRLTQLIEEILKARGYYTYRSPEGPDNGIDILAASGPFGFRSPRICVQVKSGDTPVDRPTVDALSGAMRSAGADQGLFVSWAGFKSTVDRETPRHFFALRFWDQDAIIDELLETYESLDDDIRAELPLKRVWALSPSISEEE